MIMRVMVIIQLCLAFTLVFWCGSYPFMGEMMVHKKRMFLFQVVMGEGELVGRSMGGDVLLRHRERFAVLPEREEIIGAYDRMQKEYESRSFLSSLVRSFSIILFELPVFERAWIFFSVVICILLLLRFNGAIYAVWLLPLIVVCGAVDNQMLESVVETSLFPSEEYLVQNYLSGDLSGNVFQQQEFLREAWEKYLAAEWCDTGLFGDGEYAFNVALLKDEMNKSMGRHFFYRKESVGLWVIYFVWNFVFAWVSTKGKRQFRLGIQAKLAG